MSQKIIYTYGLLLPIVMMVAACATPQATPCPTSEPQACPTTAAQSIPPISGFRWEMVGESNVIITFESGDRCSMQVLNTIGKGEPLWIDVVANDNTYQDYIIWVSYLDPGKTLEDLKKYTDPIIPPAWLHIVGSMMATPMSRINTGMQLAIDSAQGPLYFTCQVNGPGSRKTIGNIGPLEWE